MWESFPTPTVATLLPLAFLGERSGFFMRQTVGLRQQRVQSARYDLSSNSFIPLELGCVGSHTLWTWTQPAIGAQIFAAWLICSEALPFFCFYSGTVIRRSHSIRCRSSLAIKTSSSNPQRRSTRLAQRNGRRPRHGCLVPNNYVEWHPRTLRAMTSRLINWPISRPASDTSLTLLSSPRVAKK